jgi:DNA-binding NtrC family response regulator
MVSDAVDLLAAYTWPRNVGELESLIERLVTMNGGQPISVEDIPIELKVPTPLNLDDNLGETSFREIVQSTERELIVWAMRKTKGNKTRSARLLKMKPSTFRDALAKYINEIGWGA